MYRTTSAPKDRGKDLELELLRCYHRRGDFAARDEMVARTMALVHHVARRYTNRGEPYEDLVQAGSVGLLKAVDRFDPDRGVSFTSFAVPNIAGEIRRYFRDKGGAVRLPRDVHERTALVHVHRVRLEAELQRPPSTSELATAAGLTVPETMDTLVAMERQDVLSLDRQAGEDATGHDRHGTVEQGYERTETVQALKNGLRALQEREQRIVHLRFFEGLTQLEIADRIGISQMHVSRLLRQALEDMRAEMEQPREGRRSG